MISTILSTVQMSLSDGFVKLIMNCFNVNSKVFKKIEHKEFDIPRSEFVNVPQTIIK